MAKEQLNRRQNENLIYKEKKKNEQAAYKHRHTFVFFSFILIDVLGQVYAVCILLLSLFVSIYAQLDLLVCSMHILRVL